MYIINIYIYIHTRFYSHNPCAKHSSGAVYVRINSISALCGSRMVRGWPPTGPTGFTGFVGPTGPTGPTRPVGPSGTKH